MAGPPGRRPWIVLPLAAGLLLVVWVLVGPSAAPPAAATVRPADATPAKDEAKPTPQRPGPPHQNTPVTPPAAAAPVSATAATTIAFTHRTLGALSWIDVLPRFDADLRIQGQGLVDFVLECLAAQTDMSGVHKTVVYAGRQLQDVTNMGTHLPIQGVREQFVARADGAQVHVNLDPTVPKQFALMTIALHGEDYWFRTAVSLTDLRPWLILQEVNTLVDPRQFRTVPLCSSSLPVEMPRHKRNSIRGESPYTSSVNFGAVATFGASLAALDYANRMHGYLLLHCEVSGEFCLWVRADILTFQQRQQLQAVWLESKFKPANGFRVGVRPEAVQWSFISTQQDGSMRTPTRYHIQCSVTTQPTSHSLVTVADTSGLAADQQLQDSDCQFPSTVQDSQAGGCWVVRLPDLQTDAPQQLEDYFVRLEAPSAIPDSPYLPRTLYRSKAALTGPSRTDVQPATSAPHSPSFSHSKLGHIPWYDVLPAFERMVLAQNGEDGLFEFIFNVIGEGRKEYVEIGVQDCDECNSRYLREYLGWWGHLFDNEHENPALNLTKATVKGDNIVELLTTAGVSKEVDLFSLDIDSVDLWVRLAMGSHFRPRLIIHEVNTMLPPLDFRSRPANGPAETQSYITFGASLAALDAVNRANGYQLLYCELTGTNCLWIRSDLLPKAALADLSSRSLQQFYRPPNFGRIGRRHDITWSDPPAMFYDRGTRCLIDPKLRERYKRCWIDTRDHGWELSATIDERYLERSFRDARF